MSNLKGIHDYTIAEHPIRIEFLEDGRNDTRLLPSFAPFEIEGRHEEETLFFQLTVDDTMRPEPKERRERIRKFDTGNGETVVDLVDDGGYQYIIKDINDGILSNQISLAAFPSGRKRCYRRDIHITIDRRSKSSRDRCS